MDDRRDSAVAIAWGGTALFAVSLLWFAYCYFVRFDRLSPGAVSPSTAVVIDVLLFSLFALHHSLLARRPAKGYVERMIPSELERSAYTWIASALFILVCTLWQPVPWVLYRLDGGWRIAAFAIQGLGIILTIGASRALGVLNLSGVRQVQRRESTIIRNAPLKTNGLYGVVRHPLYFAWALMVCATPDMTATRAVFAAVSTAYLAIAIPWEERELIQVFGNDYERYRRQVRWRMLPWIY
jgi:methanethiol S-methyltransferase